jgi:hypothetical protein
MCRFKINLRKRRIIQIQDIHLSIRNCKGSGQWYKQSRISPSIERVLTLQHEIYRYFR